MRRACHEPEPGGTGHANRQPRVADGIAFRIAIDDCADALPDGITDPQSGDAEPDDRARATLAEAGADDEGPRLFPAR